MIRQYYSEVGKKWFRTIAGLFLILIIVFLTNISLGSVAIELSALINFVFSSSTGVDNWDLILLNFRMPKAITAALVGASLGISGLQMQTLFKNPLAGPFVLGISSGAGLGVAIVIFVGVYFGVFLEMTGLGRNWLLVLSAGGGSFLVLLTILLVSSKVKDGVSLLIVGLMFGTVASALVSIMQFFSQAENIQAYVIWSFGSLGGVSKQELAVLSLLLCLGLVGSFLLSKPLNALLMGENYATSVGLNTTKARFLIILNTSVLAGTVTAFCGPIAFIGLAVPHLARMLFNTSNHLQLTPIVILFGAILMLVFDIISQVPGSDITLPLNAVTALFGGPFVIWVLLKKRTLNYS